MFHNQTYQMLLFSPLLIFILGVSIVSGLPSSPNRGNLDTTRQLLEAPDECSPFEDPSNPGERYERLLHPNTIIPTHFLEIKLRNSGRLDQVAETLENRMEYQAFERGFQTTNPLMTGSQRDAFAKAFSVGFADGARNVGLGEGQFGGKTTEEGEGIIRKGFNKGYNQGYQMGQSEPNAPLSRVSRGFERGLCVGYCFDILRKEVRFPSTSDVLHKSLTSTPEALNNGRTVFSISN